MEVRAALFLLATITLVSGFQLNNNCEFTLTDQSGTFESPNYPYSYPNNKLCTYTIVASAYQNVRVWCDEFYVHGGCNCNDDYLTAVGCGIFDKFCDYTGPEFTVKGNVTLIFKSNKRRNHRGFKCQYSIDGASPPVVTQKPVPTKPPTTGCDKYMDTGYYQCENGQRIIVDGLANKLPRCDGKPDCADHSDEIGCSYPTQHNRPSCECFLYQCPSGECIPNQWRCDRIKDCKVDDCDKYLAKSKSNPKREPSGAYMNLMPGSN